MSITDKLSNSFLINYHQPHSGRNLITLFSLNYHQSLCQRWFIFQEGPPLKPRDIVFFFFFTFVFLLYHFYQDEKRPVLFPAPTFYSPVFTSLVSAYENIETGCKWWRWFNLKGQDGCFKSNIKNIFRSILTEVKWAAAALLLPVFTQYHC